MPSGAVNKREPRLRAYSFEMKSLNAHAPLLHIATPRPLGYIPTRDPTGAPSLRKAAFLWHLHQPPYWLESDFSLLPWVRLHTMRDYLDFPPLLDGRPGARMTFNFSGSLLEQVLHPRSDPFWEAARTDAEALSPNERAFLLRHFFSASWDHMIRPLPRYYELLQTRGMEASPADLEEKARRMPTTALRDLQVLFHLAWCGETLRAGPVVRELLRKGRGYSEQDKGALFSLIEGSLGDALPGFRRLAARGQLSLTTTPFNHPILPLLLDARGVQERNPGIRVCTFPPQAGDAGWQMEEAFRLHREVFGADPAGVWPAEGGISEAILPLLKTRAAFSDEHVLRCSRTPRHDTRFAYTHPANPTLRLFFRHTELSNKFGFVYAGMPREHASADFFRSVHAALPDGEGVVWIILDGENPWGSYPDLGRPFLREIFERGEREGVQFVNLDDVLSLDLPVLPMESLHAGSWIDATFHIWTGDPVKNRAWDLLAEVRRMVREAGDPEAALAPVRAAEASDWFWWYGHGNDSPYKPEFDLLFRTYLQRALAEAGLPSLPALDLPLEAPASAAGRQPVGFIHPVIDGRVNSFYEWAGAEAVPILSGGSMHASGNGVESLRFGFDADHLYLRLDLAPETLERADELTVDLVVAGRKERRHRWHPASAPIESALVRVLEVKVPFVHLGLEAGQAAGFRLELAGPVSARAPWVGMTPLAVPHASFEEELWSV